MTNHVCVRDILKEVKISGEIHIVLDCHYDKVRYIFCCNCIDEIMVILMVPTMTMMMGMAILMMEMRISIMVTLIKKQKTKKDN